MMNLQIDELLQHTGIVARSFAHQSTGEPNIQSVARAVRPNSEGMVCRVQMH